MLDDRKVASVGPARDWGSCSECGLQGLQAVNLVSLLEENLGEVRSILSGDTCSRKSVSYSAGGDSTSTRHAIRTRVPFSGSAGR